MISRLFLEVLSGMWKLNNFILKKTEQYFIFSVNLLIYDFWGPFLKIKLLMGESTI